jgi:hypothetical protein
LPSFVSYDSSTKEYTISPTLASQEGQYTIEVVATDDYAFPQSYTGTFTINVFALVTYVPETSTPSEDVTEPDTEPESTIVEESTASEETTSTNEETVEEEDEDLSEEDYIEESDEKVSNGTTSSGSVNSKTFVDKKTGLRFSVVTSGSSTKLAAQIKTVSMLGLVTV